MMEKRLALSVRDVKRGGNGARNVEADGMHAPIRRCCNGEDNRRRV